MCRTGSISIPETMRYLKLARLPRTPSVPPSPIPRSTLIPVQRLGVCTILTYASSIPHVSPNPVSNSSGPHVSVQISPVNSPTSPAKESLLSQESTLADIMSTEPSPPDTTVETKPTTVTEPTEVVDPGDVPTQDIPVTGSKATGSGFGDLDIKMD